MTTATRPSKAARFAEQAAALGWEVERTLYENGEREVYAKRGDEAYVLTWDDTDHGLVFSYGGYFADITNDEPSREIKSPSAALKEMAVVPVDIEHGSDLEILQALAGKRIEWVNSITGAVESGQLPRGGMHYKLTGNNGSRTLHFSDPIHTGFRSVRLSAITRVRS